MATFGQNTSASTLEDRIREAAVVVGGLKQLSEVTGIPRRTLGNWLKGTSPKPDGLQKIVDATGVSYAWLVAGEGDKFEDDVGRALRRLEERSRADSPTMSDEDFQRALSRGLELHNRKAPSPPAAAELLEAGQIMLPRYDLRASAGAGALVISDNVAEYLSVGRDWLRRNLPGWAPPNAIVGVLEGSGDSMSPTIHDGDLIMVVQDVDWRIVERGGIFVFSLDHDRLLLKRLEVLLNGDLKVISDNKAYDPQIIPFNDIQHRIIVHGQVFFVGGKPRMHVP